MRLRRNRCIVGPIALLRKLQARIDQRAGMPKRGMLWDPETQSFSRPAPPGEGGAEHVVDVLEHPTDPTKGCIEAHPLVLPHLIAIRNAIRARKQAGTATAEESDIDALPAAVDLDETWEAPLP